MRRTRLLHKGLYHLVIWACGDKTLTITQCEVPLERGKACCKHQMEGSGSEKGLRVTADMKSPFPVQL